MEWFIWNPIAFCRANRVGYKYYELRFISSTQAEGWSKESGENQV